MWIDTAECDGKEEFVGENFGRINRAEAELTLQTLQQYLEKIGKQRILEESIDVGIISPYRAQVQLLRKELRKRDIGFLRDLRRMNVAITRARMKLIILGSSETMTSHPFYKKLYEYVGQLKVES